jgi:hypothetical protein
MNKEPTTKAARSVIETEEISTFLEALFGDDFTPGELEEEEQAVVNGILAYVRERFSNTKYVLGLALDFTLLKQKLLWGGGGECEDFEPNLTEKKLFAAYSVIEKSGNRTLNTLTLARSGKHSGETRNEGIRRIEEKVTDLFHSLDRTGYPSAYVYNTGQWQKHRVLLVECFKLSQSGRYVITNDLIDFGLSTMQKASFYVRETHRPKLFHAIVHEFPRGAVDGENAGLMFQAIAYGYFKADRPHLNIVVDKVRTGSSRQRRFGDIDLYSGLDLEVSVEVKDMNIGSGNLGHQLGLFMKKALARNLPGLIFAGSIEVDARQLIVEDGFQIVTQDELLNEIRRWDWQKQDSAVNGLMHYLSNIEQNPEAVLRLLEFIAIRDPHSPLLAHLRPTDLKASEGPIEPN